MKITESNSFNLSLPGRRGNIILTPHFLSKLYSAIDPNGPARPSSQIITYELKKKELISRGNGKKIR